MPVAADRGAEIIQSAAMKPPARADLELLGFCMHQCLSSHLMAMIRLCNHTYILGLVVPVFRSCYTPFRVWLVHNLHIHLQLLVGVSREKSS